MQPVTIIISGKNGQLGSELQDAAIKFAQFHCHFFARDELNIENKEALEDIFKKYKPEYFINAAAYTWVDKAETDQEKAYLINAVSPGIIAEICKRNNAKLFQISTDYVFDGKATQPYEEDNETKPINYYGFSKWMGEQVALANNPETIVIRTSWVYSIYGNNFVKTMLRLMKERTSINVVNDQIGAPTYAKDLAELILQIIESSNRSVNTFKPGIYHFSNEGIISWFDFANAIKEIKNLNCTINPITTEQYPTPAKRPGYSVMNKNKIQATFKINIKPWKQSLEECLDKL